MSESFVWLRPAWLLAAPAALALMVLWWRARSGPGPWRPLVDPELLAQLAGRAPRVSARLALGAAGAALALACIALAGPSWRAQPAPLVRDLGARIIVLDLSPSMDAIDVAPSRLERARAAVGAILRASNDAQLGLVVFAGDAFTVAPLTHDAATLVYLLASLDTTPPPRAGARPDLGLAMAQALLTQAEVAAGEVILVGDSAGDARALAAARALAHAGFPLSVLAVGTPLGGPVRLASGAFARSEGEIVVAKLDLPALRRLAREGGGRFHALTGGDAAPRFAHAAQAWAQSAHAQARGPMLRQDDGAWFVLFALPFAALLFRRGWLLGVAAFAIALPPPTAHAFDWADLWQRAEQQAAAAFAQGRFGGQEQLIDKLEPGSPWHAMLLYREGRFAEATGYFGARDTADAHYNRGNALALDGRLEAALAAYGRALERDPGMRDALFNRAVLREVLAKRRARGPADDGVPRTGSRAQREAAQGATSGAGANAARAARETRAHAARPRPQTGPGSRPRQNAAGAAPAQAHPDEAAARAKLELRGEELRRLEGLLAEIPDEPGTLLANRFAWQLRLGGIGHRDTGAQW